MAFGFPCSTPNSSRSRGTSRQQPGIASSPPNMKAVSCHSFLPFDVSLTQCAKATVTTFIFIQIGTLLRLNGHLLIIKLGQPEIYTRIVSGKPGNYGMTFFSLWSG